MVVGAVVVNVANEVVVVVLVVTADASVVVTGSAEAAECSFLDT